jgi:hypothetical protein
MRGQKRVGVGMGAVEEFEKTGFCAEKNISFELK